MDQVWNYALDLKNFNKASHAASIVPSLVATEAATNAIQKNLRPDDDKVYSPVAVGADGLPGGAEDGVTFQHD